MAEESNQASPERRPVVWIFFCPEFGMYYYRNEQDLNVDPIVWKFTHDELLVHVEGLIKAGKPDAPKEIILIAAWARAFAHMVVVLFTDGTFEARKPAPLPAEVQEDVSEMQAYVEKWKEEHKDKGKVEVAPAFGRPDSSGGGL
jgi:hypothetical protein